MLIEVSSWFYRRLDSTEEVDMRSGMLEQRMLRVFSILPVFFFMLCTAILCQSVCVNKAYGASGQSPELTAPADGFTQTAKGPLTFEWRSVAGATDYGIELLSAPPENPNGDAPSVYRIVADISPNGTTPSYPGDTSELVPGTYYWRVIAISDQGIHGLFSDAWSFTVPVKKPVLTAPQDRSIKSVKGPLTFEWQVLEGATAYGIELLSAPPENPNGNIPSVYRIGAGLSPGGQPVFPGNTENLSDGTYYWRVIALNDQGLYGFFSDAWSFTIPPRPGLAAPENSYSQSDRGSILFDWYDLPGAISYGIELLSQLPDDSERNTDYPSQYRIGADLSPGGASQFMGDTSGLAPGTYYWRVIAVDDQGLYGVFSDPWAFSVPAKPVLGSPGHGFSQPKRGPLNFTWQVLPGATDYAIELLSAPPENPNGTAASMYRIVADLSPNGSIPSYPGNTSGLAPGMYYWRIIAINAQGIYGVFSDAWSFTVPRTLISPVSGATWTDYAPGEWSDHGPAGHGVWLGGDAYDVMCGNGVFVYAAHTGTVTEVGYGRYGWTVVEGEGFTTCYAHAEPFHSVGATIAAGQAVGIVQGFGHLHFELIDSGQAIPAGDYQFYF